MSDPFTNQTTSPLVNVPELDLERIDPNQALREVYQAYPSLADQRLPRLTNNIVNPALTSTVNTVANEYLPAGRGFNYDGPFGYADVNQKLLGTAPNISLGPEITWSRAQPRDTGGGIQPFKSNVYFDAGGTASGMDIEDIVAGIQNGIKNTELTGGAGNVGAGGGGTGGGAEGLLPWDRPNWIPDGSGVTGTGYIINPGDSSKYPGGAVVTKVDGGWTITDNNNPTDDPIFVRDVSGGGSNFIPTGEGSGGTGTDIGGVGGGTGIGGGLISSFGGGMGGGGAYDFKPGGGYAGGSGFIVVDDPDKGPSMLEQMMGMRYDKDFMEDGDLGGDRGRTVGGGRAPSTGPSTYEEWLNFRRDPDVELQTKGEKAFEDIMKLGNKYLGPTRFDEGELQGDKGMFIRGVGKLRDWFLGLSDERIKIWEDKGIPSELTGRNPFGPDYVDAIRNIRDILQNKDGIKIQEYGDLQMPGLLFAAGLISQYGSQVGLPLAAINMSNDIMSATNNMFAERPEFAGNPIQDVIHTAFWVPGKIGKEMWNATIGKVLPKIQDTTIKDKLNNATLGKLRNPPKSSPRIRVSVKGKEVGLGQPPQVEKPSGITGKVTPLPKPPRTTAPFGMPPAGRGTTPEGSSKTRPTRGQGQLVVGKDFYDSGEFKGDPVTGTVTNVGGDPRDRIKGKDGEDIGDRPTVGDYDYITPLPADPRDPSDPKPSDPRDPGHPDYVDPNVSDPNVPAGDTPKGKYTKEYVNVPVDARGFPFGTDQFDDTNYFGETAPRVYMHFTKLGKDNPNAGQEEANYLRDLQIFTANSENLVRENTARNDPPDTTNEGGLPGQIEGSDGKYYDPNPGGWKDPYNKGLGLIDQFDSSTWDFNQAWDDSISDFERGLLPSTHPQHSNNKPADTNTGFNPLDDDTNVWGGAGGGGTKPNPSPITGWEQQAGLQSIINDTQFDYVDGNYQQINTQLVLESEVVKDSFTKSGWAYKYRYKDPSKPFEVPQWNYWVPPGD